jgi:hypothetical protein
MENWLLGLNAWKSRPVPVKEPAKFECHACQQSWKRKADLMQHLKFKPLHKSVKTAEKCPECKKWFSTLQVMATYILKKHSKEEPKEPCAQLALMPQKCCP